MHDKYFNKQFRQGYDSYRKICTFCIDNIHLLNVPGDDTQVAAAVMQDLEVQYILLETAHNDLSYAERTFIQSLIENPDILKRMFPGYGKFYRHMTAENYLGIKHIFEKHLEDIPVTLILAAKKGEPYVYDIYGHWVSLLFAFASVSPGDTGVKFENAKSMLDKYKAFLKNEGYDAEYITDRFTPQYQTTGSVSDAVSQMNSLVGLSSVKKDVMNTLNFITVNKIRIEKELPPIDITRHFVFTGSPGTGKTTVARILARVYHENGICANDNFIETDRSGLVDTIIGGTAQKVLRAVESALGGVLFIDEAYALSQSDSDRDFGREAVATLVKLMDDNRDDLIVIAAGYKDEMKTFIESNPGLKSRFTSFIDFADYTPGEMQEIFISFADKDGYTLKEGCAAALFDIWDAAHKDKSFGNGRGVRNVYEKTLVNLASRIVNTKNPQKGDLITIYPQDIPSRRDIFKDDKKKLIGFS